MGSRAIVLGRVQLLLGRVDGRIQGVRAQGDRVQKVPSHHILVRLVLVPFEVSRKWSRVGVGKDIMQLRQNVSGIGLKRLLSNCPVCNSKQQSVLLEKREWGEGDKEPPVDIQHPALKELGRLLLVGQGFL